MAQESLSENPSQTEKFNLKENVSYVQGSVVSKVLVRNEKGNITLFAFDKGEQLSEHTAPFDALVQVLDGTVEIILGGKKHVLSEGECIIMPAGVTHALTAVEKFKMLLTMIRG